MSQIAFLKPMMPSAETLLPYLKQIDQNQQYTNAGPLLQAFEHNILDLLPSQAQGQLQLAAVSSGTTALEIALKALRLPKGAKVLVPAYTFIASAIAILNAGLEPVIVDVCADSWQLSPELASQHSQARDDIAAVMPVAVFGAPVDMPAWAAFSKQHRLPVVIDAAGAFANEALCDDVIVCYSLHATKTFGVGEGGLIVSTQRELIERAQRLRQFALHDGTVSELGNNAKLSEYHAAVGLAQCARWPDLRNQLLETREQYLSILEGDIEGHAHPGELMCSQLFAWQFEQTCAPFVAALDKKQIPYRAYYTPLLHEHPAFKAYATEGIVTAKAIADRTVCLPFHANLSTTEMALIRSTLSSHA